MKVPVEVLCSPELAPGMALIGLPTSVASGIVEGARQLGEWIGSGRRAVVLVDEEIFNALPRQTRRSLARRTLPMIVPFPRPDWGAPGPREAYIVELLRQAIGYQVRLR